MKLYLAEMKWCERNEAVCVGTNKAKLALEALRILREEHGTGPVDRGQAMCSVPITLDDIKIKEIPFLDSRKVVSSEFFIAMRTSDGYRIGTSPKKFSSMGECEDRIKEITGGGPDDLLRPAQVTVFK